MELAYIDVPDEFTGAASQSFSSARASLEIWALSQADTPDSSSISLHVDLSDTVVSS